MQHSTNITAIAFIACLLLGAPALACSSHGFVSASVERKINGYWLGDYPATIQAGYRFKVADHFYLAPIVSHHSNWELGWPNGETHEPETWVNTYGIEIEGRF